MKKHADALKYFEQGWAALPDIFKEGWLRSGQKTRLFKGLLRPEPPAKGFTSWTQYLFRVNLNRRRFKKPKTDNTNVSQYPDSIIAENAEDPNPYLYTGKVLLDTIEHEGALYGQPAAPESQQHLTSSPKKRKDEGREDNVGQLKRNIAFSALDLYLENEKRKSLKRLRERIDKEGTDAILSYFKENSLDWP